MAYMPLPPLELLNKRLRYDPDTGHLMWNALSPNDFVPKGRKTAEEMCNNFNTAHAGKRAGSHNQKKGYWYIGVQQKVYAVHRIAWKMATGQDPEGEVDHINGDPEDNRIDNLQVVTRAENNRLKTRRRRTAAWRKGVVWTGSTWVATAGTPGRKSFVNLGQFETRDEAIHARFSYERRKQGRA